MWRGLARGRQTTSKPMISTCRPAAGGAVAGARPTPLHAALTPQDVARLGTRPTDNVEAYDLYLQARGGWGSGLGTPEMLAHMQPLLEHAVQLDPRFRSEERRVGKECRY